MRFRLKNKETTSFKKRFNTIVGKPFLKFGLFALIFSNKSSVEFNYIAYFKKILKIFFKFKKSKLKKVWIFLNKNFPITKKSKNARMGKGKGKISRYVMRVGGNFTILEFYGFSVSHLLKIKTVFNYRLRMRLFLFSSFFLKKNIFFFKKSEKNYNIKYRNL